MFLPRGGCKHPVIVLEKTSPRISPRAAAQRSGMFGRVKNIVDTIFFTPNVFATKRLQTSCDRIGETRCGISPCGAAPRSGMVGKDERIHLIQTDSSLFSWLDFVRDAMFDAAGDAMICADRLAKTLFYSAPKEMLLSRYPPYTFKSISRRLRASRIRFNLNS